MHHPPYGFDATRQQNPASTALAMPQLMWKAT
jgi:hypothetical protein